MLLKYRWMAIMPFVPISVKKFKFPCWGKPAVTQNFVISIKHHHTFRALSNMPIRTQFKFDDGMVWTHFNITPSMSSCLVAVVLTDFVLVPSANKTTNQIWCRSNVTSHMRYAQSIVEKARDDIIQYTGIFDKIIKIDHISIPNYSFHGMAYWGLIIYE